MLIDWYTVGAQVLNFLVLVWLMRSYLYKPVLDAIDQREARIASELEDAAQKKAEAKTEREIFERKNHEFDAARAALMKSTAEEADAARKRLLDEARHSVDDLASGWKQSLDHEARSLNEEFARRAQQEVFEIVRQVFADLSTANLNDNICDLFISRLRAVDGPTRAGLDAAIDAAPENALVRSAFKLSPERRTTIERVVDELFSASIVVRFEIAPELIGGIELVVGGQKLSWSIAGYLASMQTNVAELANARFCQRV